MMLKLNAVSLLAVLTSLTSALPSNQGPLEAGLVARQVQYSCVIVPAEQVGECQNAIQDLRARELRGCNVWCKYLWLVVSRSWLTLYNSLHFRPVWYHSSLWSCLRWGRRQYVTIYLIWNLANKHRSSSWRRLSWSCSCLGRFMQPLWSGGGLDAKTIDYA